MIKKLISLLILLSFFCLPSFGQKLSSNDFDALNQIEKDMGALKGTFRNRSIGEIEAIPRISISGNWNQECLTNLFTLIQNQGITRKYLNGGLSASIDGMMNLASLISIPIRGLVKVVSTKAIMEALKSAISKKDFVKEVEKKIKEENDGKFPEGEAGDKFRKRLEHLYELKDIIQHNKAGQKVDIEAEYLWKLWAFDPANSSLDDLASLAGMENSKPILPSTAIARFGEVDPDLNPMDKRDVKAGKGKFALKTIIKGVAETAYPANSVCKGQIESYEITITNYGHYKEKKFISDYITYDIELYCCEEEEEEEEISYLEEPQTEPISYGPGTDYNLLVGGGLGVGRQQDENSLCVQGIAQYFPNLPVGPCGAQPAVGLKAGLDYSNFDNGFSSNTNTALKLEPQLLLFMPALNNQVSILGGLSFPFSFGNRTFESTAGEIQKDNVNSAGVALTTGLALHFPNWVFQLQTDLASFHKTTFKSQDQPDIRSSIDDFSLGLNKNNQVDLTISRSF